MAEHKAGYIGLVVINILAGLSFLYSFYTLFAGRISITNWKTTHILNLNTESLGLYFYIIPVIQFIITYFLFLLGYGYFLLYFMQHKKRVMRLEHSKPKKKADLLPSLMDPSKLSPSQINKLLFAFTSPNPPTRKNAAEMLKRISLENPKKLYKKIDFFIHFLNNENKILRINAVDIIANLVEVDNKNIFVKHIDKYYDILDEEEETADHVVDNSTLIIRAKPKLINEVTIRLLKVDKLKTAYKDKLLDKVITFLDKFYENIEDKNSVIAFVKKQTKNKKISKKARDFVKKHS